MEAHGTISTCSCIDCKRPQKIEWFRKQVLSGKRPLCKCGGLIKPDIVFFGEPLPHKFNWMSTADMASCDLLIVMGTSLAVQPFAGTLCVTNDLFGLFHAKMRESCHIMVFDL